MASSLSSSSPPGLVPFGLPSPASSLDHPLQSPTSAFRPIAPSGDSFFLSAIHTLVLSSPGADDTLSESNASSDKGCSDDLSTTSSTAHLLCQVCSDRASGFHYGVFACEGCKGFFRRSIQQKIQYRPCSRSQECLIVRNNRNRCQYCRLKKCISVGMSRDAVRFGRVPKREKAKMVEDMQRTTAQSQLDAVAVQFESDTEATDRIQHAFSQLIVTMEASYRPIPGRCPLQFHSYLLSIKAVIDFANAVPGFLCLPQTERIALLKGSILDVLLIAWSASPQSSQWLPSSSLLSQSLLHFSRRVRLLPSPATPAILASLCVVQPLPTQPLALRLSERLWMLLARVGGAPALTAAPGLISDLRVLRMCHNEFLRAAPAPPSSTPLTVSVTPPESAPPQKSYRERHPSIASLLEKPVVNINLLSPASSGGLGSFCESEDEPLNLCLRDS